MNTSLEHAKALADSLLGDYTTTDEVRTIQKHMEAFGKEQSMNDLKIEEAFNHGVASVIYTRCAKHYPVPQQNKNEHSGGECGGCIAEERDFYKLQYEAVKMEINQRLDELHQLKEANRELLKDKERIDDLNNALFRYEPVFQFHSYCSEENMRKTLRNGPYLDQISITIFNGHTTKEYTGRNLREAIDKAALAKGEV